LNAKKIASAMISCLTTYPIFDSIEQVRPTEHEFATWNDRIGHLCGQLLAALGFEAPRHPSDLGLSKKTSARGTPFDLIKETIDQILGIYYSTGMQNVQVFKKVKEIAKIIDEKYPDIMNQETKNNILKIYETISWYDITPKEINNIPNIIFLLRKFAEVSSNFYSNVDQKMNIERYFIKSLFINLSALYFSVYGVRPAHSTAAREPFGVGTLWVQRVVQLASERAQVCFEEAISIDPDRSGSWLVLVRDQLRTVSQFSAVTIKKGLSANWPAAGVMPGHRYDISFDIPRTTPIL